MAVTPPRIAILGMHLESNAFAPPTTGDDFHGSCYLVGEDILTEAAKPAPAMPAEIPGFIAEMNRAGAWEPARRPPAKVRTGPGGDSVAARSSPRLPFSPALPLRHGAVPRRAAAPQGNRPEPILRLPPQRRSRRLTGRVVAGAVESARRGDAGRRSSG